MKFAELLETASTIDAGGNGIPGPGIEVLKWERVKVFNFKT
jgi:hypothetical protein